MSSVKNDELYGNEVWKLNTKQCREGIMIIVFVRPKYETDDTIKYKVLRLMCVL